MTEESQATEAEEAHHPLGPSAASRWLNCPGSVQATAGLPDTTSEYAAEGTAAHTVTEWCRKQGRPATDFIGTEIEVDGYSFTVDNDMADACQSFVDYVEALPGDAFYEVKVSFDPWVSGAFGTADDIRIDANSKTVYVADYKHGKGEVVDVEGNPQMKVYALGAVHDFGFVYDFDEDWQVVPIVHQPRIGNVQRGEPIPLTDLLAWGDDVVKPAAEEAMQPGGRFAAGAWCRWCKIRGGCTHRAAKILEEDLADFENLEDAGVHLLRGEDLGRILDKLGEIKRFVEDVEAHGRSELSAGHPPVGAAGPYKLVAGRGSRNWTDEEAARKALQRKLGAKNIWIQKLISPAQAEKQLGKDSSLLDKYVEKRGGSPTMVPGSDKRPALVADASDEFDDLSAGADAQGGDDNNNKA